MRKEPTLQVMHWVGQIPVAWVRCVQASSCPVWLHLWMHTGECSASHLLVLRETQGNCGWAGPSGQTSGFWQQSSLREKVYFTIARAEGITPLWLIFILSSLDEHKPCPGDVKGVCLICICQLTAQSGKAVSRKGSTRASFSLWTAQSDWVNLSAQTGEEGKINSPWGPISYSLW